MSAGDFYINFSLCRLPISFAQLLTLPQGLQTASMFMQQHLVKVRATAAYCTGLRQEEREGMRRYCACSDSTSLTTWRTFKCQTSRLQYETQVRTTNNAVLIERTTETVRPHRGTVEGVSLNKRPTAARSLLSKSLERNCCCWLWKQKPSQGGWRWFLFCSISVT